MTVIRAEQALLPQGWRENVRVEIGEDGRIRSVSLPRNAHEAVSNAQPSRDGVHGANTCSDSCHDRTGTAAAGAGTDEVAVGVLLPAPVNLHSHAFQRAMAGLTEQRGSDPKDSFWTWRERMYHFLHHLTPDHVEAIAALVQMEMLEAGYATNIEFHYLHHQASGQSYDNPAEMAERIAAATDISGIGLTLLPVHYQYGGCDQRALGLGQRRFATDLDTYEALFQASRLAIRALPADTVIGVAPHSLRAVSGDAFAELLQIAPQAPIHMHLAEQTREVQEVLSVLGARPVDWLLTNVDVGPRWCLIHCTQMQAHETQALAKSGAVAGLCPITESNLGDGIFEGIAYLEAGGRVGIGSDSNIRISLSEEVRTLEYSQRLRDHSRAALATSGKSTGRRLYDAIVAGGAQAAGRSCGRIEVGQWADLLSLDTRHHDLAGLTADTVLDAFFFAGKDSFVQDVWSAGRHCVRGGHHVRRAKIIQRYISTLETLRQESVFG